MIPTGRQIREGRQLAGMSQIDLATTARVTFDLLIRAELADDVPLVMRRDLASIQRVLERAGVLFIAENGEGPGVRLRKVGPAEG